MFSISSNPLKLIIADHAVQFRTVDDFEFALNGRTSIPADKISRLVSMPDTDLLREAEGIRKLERRLADILSDSLEKSKEVGPTLQVLDMSLVTQDNDWRTIIETLNLTDEKLEPYKRMAIVKYMQYLRARQDVIRVLFSQRLLDRAEAATQALHASGAQQPMRETSVFDLPEEAQDDEELYRLPLYRLPKGKTIEITIAVGDSVPLRLVHQSCEIRNENGELIFMDESGLQTPLTPGQHTVGRSEDCEINLHPEQQDLSRKHLVIDAAQEGTVKLTDISSLGTFMPSECVPS
ncbi:MAG: FHA domain-containing protein [Gammaproteobacteria bacterium]|nr:FHA domain-containing protein [Gammaproteobacteria bacterium]